jgi:ribose/xylose/arabinose/galactoside ABC-type transport system permease subunit
MKIRLSPENIPIVATFSVFFLIYIIGGFMYSGFFSRRVFVNLFIDNAFLGIIAVGMTFVIISGGIDLSLGSVIAFTSVFLAKLIEVYHFHPLPAIILSLMIGSMAGLTMGSLIHYFSLPPFLVTLVGMFMFRGMAFLVSLNSIPIKHEFFTRIIQFGIPLGGGVVLPATAIVFIIVLIIGIYILHFTRFGRNVYAIGGNEQSAILMGLPVGRTKIAIYTMNSTLCALAGIVYALYTSSGYALACVGLELDAIAAVVIGGTLLTGGIGFVEGTLVGVLILGLIQTFITFQGTLSSWWTKIVIGILLFIFILLQRYLAKSRVKHFH